jgi:hypothetical protein
MNTYKIIRMFQAQRQNEVVKTGLTLEQAQEHCSDPETSSRTCTAPERRERTERSGPWFDGDSSE